MFFKISIWPSVVSTVVGQRQNIGFNNNSLQEGNRFASPPLLSDRSFWGQICVVVHRHQEKMNRFEGEEQDIAVWSFLKNSGKLLCDDLIFVEWNSIKFVLIIIEETYL